MRLRMPGCFMHTLPFSISCNDMLAMLVCATCWLSMHLYMLAYMFMHESFLPLCRPYFNTMKIWTPDPNLHLSPTGTTIYWPFCLLTFLLVCFFCLLAFLFVCLSLHVMSPTICYACHTYLACLLCTLCTLSTHLFLSIACLLVSCSCLCTYTHGARTYRARAWSPKRKQKGQRCKHVNISQAAMFNRFRGLASPIWLCTLLNPLPSFLFSLLDGLY